MVWRGHAQGIFSSDEVLRDADSGVAIDRGLGAGPRGRALYEFDDAEVLFDNGGRHLPVAHPDNVAAIAQ